MKIKLYTIILFIFVINYLSAQDKAYTWDLKRIDTRSYQDGITKTDVITSWRNSRSDSQLLQSVMMPDDQSIQILYSEDYKYYINLLDDNLSVVRQNPLIQNDNSSISPIISNDGCCLFLESSNLNDSSFGKMHYFYILEKDMDGGFTKKRLVYSKNSDEALITAFSLSADGNTLLFQEDNGDSSTAYVIENTKSDQPKITKIAGPMIQMSGKISISGNGKHVFVYVKDPRSPDDSNPNEYTEKKSMTFYSTTENGVWTKAVPLIIDGIEIKSSVSDLDMDANIICIGSQIAERIGKEFKTIHTFTTPKSTNWGHTLSNDGKTLLYAVDNLSTVTTPLLFSQRYTPMGDFYKTALIMVKFEDNQIPAAQTITLDEGYWMQFHFSKKLNRLLWTLQNESPDNGTKVKIWNKY